MNETAMARKVAAAQDQQPDIWAQMSYIPPRGPCSQRVSLLTACPCFRFMIHPLKASTSFECDGCGHHASFHKMDNHQDDETVRQWKSEQEADDLKRKLMIDLSASQAVRNGVQPPARQQIEPVPRDPFEDIHTIQADLVLLEATREPRPARKRQRNGD